MVNIKLDRKRHYFNRVSINAAISARLSFFICFCFLPIFLSSATLSYQVEFEGLDDNKTLKDMKLASHLTSLKKRPPASVNALRYRAESDIPSLVKVLRAHGYYEGKVTVQIHETENKAIVIVRINPGPRYQLDSFDVHLYCQSPDIENACCPIDLEDIGISLNKPAQTEPILQAELKVLDRLSECGYPLAKIENREVVVDGKTKQVHVRLDVKTGELVEFGPAVILGNKKVKTRFIEQKIEWKAGEQYNSKLVDNTQSALIDTGLFSSVLVSREEAPSSNGQIPLKIEVNETKHKSVNLGVSYQTVFGPGITFGWENRNVGGMGRTLSFQGDVTRISQTGVASYVHPDFLRIDQNMIAQAQAAHEDIYAYSMRSYSLMDRFERIINHRVRGSLGLKGNRLYVTASAQNGNYWLAEMPLYVRWSSSNSLLNPTKGGTIEYTATPAFNSANTSHIYLTQEFKGSIYNALDKKERIVIAQKLTLGFIYSNGLTAVPLCNRFLGGTEEDLRGYRYKSVSPLEDKKPLGGRAAIYYTFETRLRISEVLGLVPFFDMGSVYLTEYPTVQGKWFKSVGLGWRFFTFMGPFRVDLAFPLDRRSGIDPHYKILVSIGQMF